MPCRPALPTLLLALLLAGCATGPDVGDNIPEFPTPEELNEIKPLDPPDPLFRHRRAAVDEWRLAEPVPAEFKLVEAEPDGPWSTIVSSYLDDSEGEGTMLTRGMNCIARQYGAFRLEHGGWPSPALMRFIQSRCGVFGTPSVKMLWTREKLPATPRDAAESKLQSGDIQRELRDAFQRDNMSAGVWYGEADDSAAAVLLVGKRRVDLEPTRVVQLTAETPELRGRLLDRDRAGRLIVTDGPFDYARCTLHGEAHWPDFRARCPFDPSSDTLRFGLLTGPIRQTDLLLGIWRDRGSSRTYRRPDLDDRLKRLQPDSAATEQSNPVRSIERRFVALLNQARRQADLEPVTYEPAQSDQIRRHLGYLMSHDARPEHRQTARTVVRGIQAGWQVDEQVWDNSLMGVVTLEQTAESLLAEMLDRPSGRLFLMRPSFDHLALGVHRPTDGDGLAAVLSAYRTVDEQSLEQRSAVVLDEFNEPRQTANLPRLTTDPELDNVEAGIAAAITEEGLPLKKALDDLEDEAWERWETDVSGYRLRYAWEITPTLKALQLPDVLADRKIDRLSIIVVPVQPSGRAWTRFAILVAYRTTR